ncbi:hypothetical protein [Amycolatopsis samaneae]|uniref:Uncharacterized protein n=1 Tax=Amycolatopsis samaneae TaxID=664691 RepID=A0ABW5G8M5_9PSEU
MCLPELDCDTAPRLLFRPDAHPVATAHGVYVLVPGGGVRLDGGEAGPWLAWLVPLLDGSRTFAQLAGPLTPPRREYLTALVGTLVEAGAVLQVRREPMCERIVSQLGHYLSIPARVPARYQDGPLTVAGGGPLCAAIVRAARRSGLRAVRPVGTADPVALAAALRGTEFAIHVPEQPRAGETARLERMCAAVGVPLVQVAVHRDEAWLALPGAAPESPPVSLASAWRRHVGGLPEGPAGELDEATTALLTSRAMLAALRHRTGGAGAAPDGGLVRVRLDTLDETRHVVLGHPFTQPVTAETADEFLARVKRLASAEPTPDEEFARRAAVLADPRFGLPGASGGDTRATLVRYGTAMVDPRRLLDRTGAPLLTARADPDAALRDLPGGEAYIWGYAWESGEAVLVRADRVFPASPGLDDLLGVAAGPDWTAAVTEGLRAHCRALRLDGVHAEPSTLVAELTSRGYRPVVVPLDHDPAVHELVPAVLRVLLDR